MINQSIIIEYHTLISYFIGQQSSNTQGQMHQEHSQNEDNISRQSQIQNRFSFMQYVSIIPQTKLGILDSRPVQISQRQIFLSKNPFIPKTPIINEGNTQCLLIFISRKQISHIQITSISMIQKKVKVVTSLQKYADDYFALAYFELNQSYQYSCCVHYHDQSLTRHRFLKGQGQSIPNKLIIMCNKDGSFTTTLNFAIFQTIQFLLSQIIQDTFLIEKQLFPWMRLLYDNYQPTDKPIQILKEICISKEGPKFTQYFIYFLYSVFREKSIELYQQCNLKDKMYFKFSCRIINKNYPNSQEISNFYLQLHLIYVINNHTSYSAEEIKNLINFNLGCQNANKRYQLLMRLGRSLPKYLVQYQEDIKQIFEQGKTLDATQFLKITITYLPYLLQQQQVNSQGKYLMKLMNNLIELAKRRQSNSGTVVNQVQINTLLYSQYGNVKSLRIPLIMLPKLYSKCKVLKSLTKKSINLTKNLQQIMQPRMKMLLKSIKIKTALSLLLIPVNKFDKAQLDTIFDQKQMKTQQISQLLTVIIQNKNNQFDIDYLLQKILQIGEIQINKIAQSLDKKICLQKNNNPEDDSRIFLINKLFMDFTSKMQISNQNILTKMLESGNKLKDRQLKNAFVSKIFTRIRIKNDLLEIAQRLIAIYGKQFRDLCSVYLLMCRN